MGKSSATSTRRTVDKQNKYQNYTREDEGDIPCLDGQPYPSMPDITVTKEGVEKTSEED